MKYQACVSIHGGPTERVGPVEDTVAAARANAAEAISRWPASVGPGAPSVAWWVETIEDSARLSDD